jgi:S-adenosyl-L-methionine hydrolase (adenosine-forming)
MATIITLTTDFGTQDGFIGAMKGTILSICPEVNLVDVTHDIPPQDIYQCSLSLLRSSPRFPPCSIHVVVVDPGVGSERRALLLKSEGHWYIGPDNGIFSEIIKQFGTEEVYEIHKKTEFWESHSSFDGLALFAPVAGHLAKGKPAIEIGGPIQRMLEIIPDSTPVFSKGRIEGKILGFDHFGNAITNISFQNLSQLQRSVPSIICKKIHFSLVNHYEAGREKSAIALINSDGYLELAVFRNSAFRNFNLRKGDGVILS